MMPRPRTSFHQLPCGCRTCGCACAEHSPTRNEWACSACVATFLAREAATLVALGLFFGCVMVWAAIFGG